MGERLLCGETGKDFSEVGGGACWLPVETPLKGMGP